MPETIPEQVKPSKQIKRIPKRHEGALDSVKNDINLAANFVLQQASSIETRQHLISRDLRLNSQERITNSVSPQGFAQKETPAIPRQTTDFEESAQIQIGCQSIRNSNRKGAHLTQSVSNAAFTHERAGRF